MILLSSPHRIAGLLLDRSKRHSSLFPLRSAMPADPVLFLVRTRTPALFDKPMAGSGLLGALRSGRKAAKRREKFDVAPPGERAACWFRHIDPGARPPTTNLGRCGLHGFLCNPMGLSAACLRQKARAANSRALCGFLRLPGSSGTAESCPDAAPTLPIALHQCAAPRTCSCSDQARSDPAI
jgi:hypothetical protein